MFLDGLFVIMQAKIVEIALKHIPMPKDDDIVSVKVLSVEKQIEKRKRAAEEAGAVIDVAAKKVGFGELRTRSSLPLAHKHEEWDALGMNLWCWNCVRPAMS